MSRAKRDDLLSRRGWGPVLLDNIFNEIERVLKRQQSIPEETRRRDDDAPLEGERSDHL